MSTTFFLLDSNTRARRRKQNVVASRLSRVSCACRNTPCARALGQAIATHFPEVQFLLVTISGLLVRIISVPRPSLFTDSIFSHFLAIECS